MAEPRVWTVADRALLCLDLRDLLPKPAEHAKYTGWFAHRLGLNPFEQSAVLYRELARLERWGLVEGDRDLSRGYVHWRLTVAGVEAPDEAWIARRRNQRGGRR